MYQLQPSYKKLLGSSVKALLLTLMLMSSALAYSQTVTIGGSVFGGGDHGKVLTDSEITINDAHVMGDVYGGGNQGDLDGKTNVVLRGGNFEGGIFGGARMANIGKRAYINVDGAGQLHDITANYIFGGNDISGHIGDNLDGTETLPFEIEINAIAQAVKADSVVVDKSWQSFIHTTKEAEGKHIYVGQMFGGGNGAYVFREKTGGGYEVVRNSDSRTDTVVAEVDDEMPAPEVAKTYMQVNGGTYGYVFAGGNAATVTESAVISINNKSEVTTETSHLNVSNYTLIENLNIEALDNPVDLRLLNMGMNLSTFNNDRQFIRIFGGNNKADMKIRPVWNLQEGSVHNLYSGGNEGRMTNLRGLLLELKEDSKIVADNIFGGCRKADVHPLRADGSDASENEIMLEVPGYSFPKGYSARVLVRGGEIQNVYGGNDISGDVYGGNAIGIATSISGDVYGGGNGSYAYTDNPELKGDIIWGDFYYDKGVSSVDSLDKLRPHAEQVIIHVKGESEVNPTVIGGSIYVGGNSASLRSRNVASQPTAELQIGAYVYADNVFLGNNGVNMVDATPNGVLSKYAGSVYGADKVQRPFSSLDLEDSDIFAKYMRGCAMELVPSISFDADYVNHEYSTYFGSFFCGGNVGSIITPLNNPRTGKSYTDINFNHHVVIYEKLVGGCNNAYVEAHPGLNAEYKGGILNTEGEQGAGPIQDKLHLNLEGLEIKPMRWMKDASDNYVLDANGNRQLEWNTYDYNTTTHEYVKADAPTTLPAGGIATETDRNRRLQGGNIYGGCYNSGHIDGNVVINLNGTILNRWNIFDTIEEDEDGEAKLYGNDTYHITARHSGVILNEQGMDVLGKALNVFGGGYGENSEIWGSTTINLKKGFTFQIFGGSEHGAIGKKNSSGQYEYDERYSTYVNLCGDIPGVARNAAGDSNDMAATEFIYGGGFEGPICGNTHINLGNGRVFNTFAGSCNADILGHTETYVGRGSQSDEEDALGFPYIRDHIYGGNDLGGKILNTNNYDFAARVSETARDKVYNPTGATVPEVLKASAYIEYLQGRVDYIYGGCYGYYDYKDDLFKDYTYTTNSPDKTEANLGLARPGFIKPRMESAFVNFKPIRTRADNRVLRIYGAGEGYPGEIGKDSLQNRSYVLVDVPQGWQDFLSTQVFGAGDYSGLGMGVVPAEAKANETGVVASAVVDMVRGQINMAFGGSYNEGVTRRTIVNVPVGSTISVPQIYGGAYGVEGNENPCDVYESHVNYSSGAARTSFIYGGNNNFRRTLYAQVNVNAPIIQSNGYDGTVYGAGNGAGTWAEYTEVNINDGGTLYEAYGGGYNGRVLNKQSLKAFKASEEAAGRTLGLDLGAGYTNDYLDNDLARETAYYTETGIAEFEKFNANVHIYEGGLVNNYCYGGGNGSQAIVSGTAYIDLLGGTVNKDIYASGTQGYVRNQYQTTGEDYFVAKTMAYAKGGTARNVYGSGWRGGVGYHEGLFSNVANNATDDWGIANVVIGDRDGDSFINGIPAIKRNVYGAGEGGPVFGRTNVIVNKGYIGYNYDDSRSDDPATTNFDERYQAEVDEPDKGKEGIGTLEQYSGNVFGGGYVAETSADTTYVNMYGGVVRSSVYGGGEIGTIGRGTVRSDKPAPTGTFINGVAKIYKGGATYVNIWDGHVRRDVFGGGRGFDNWNGEGYMTAEELVTLDRSSKGYVFGTTEVNIRGGEIGTPEGVGEGYGNVFGGGNIGFVYSATGNKSGERFDDADEGYYYQYADGSFVLNGSEKILTEDCRVIVEPWTPVLNDVEIGGTTYHAGDYVPTSDLDKLLNKNADAARWSQLDVDGIIIRNAVFAGGNVSTGSDQVYANISTVIGNATATIHDVYNRDLITIGTEHVGGLYGDGNLTFVDGYRELNVTNYGTDYYNTDSNISLETYNTLSDREKAYFELKYKCIQAFEYNGKSYSEGSILTQTEFKDIFGGETNSYINADGTPNTAYWETEGFCTIYAGRLMNTLQRADFAGIFGSRMVLQGARDRVPQVVDYTNYTINRVREVSLNQIATKASGESAENTSHGNYFGIYNIVNFMGALTSDVDFHSVRKSSALEEKYAEDGKTYYQWKESHATKRERNNGDSANKVALASGVYLELTTEKGTKENKDWGYITGVVELDLINVMTGQGGGYVYAKNEHGTRSGTGLTQTILSEYNRNAVTKKAFTYSVPNDTRHVIETSGNFIHSTKQIIDDCYPTSGKYLQPDEAAAHYWYIKGSIYVYDQYISAYTGSASPYKETVNIPLTITAASHGKISLEDVQPNLYAYYSDSGKEHKLGQDETMLINNVTYHLNDTIGYWDWMLLSEPDRQKFVRETYTVVSDCKIGETEYKKGYTMLPEEYSAFTVDSVYSVGQERNVAFGEVFRPSNNISHDKGYVLTLELNNPQVWDDYYTNHVNKTDKILAKVFQTLSTAEQAQYTESPTYTATVSGVYGQREYTTGDIIPGEVYDSYESLGEHKPASSGQAKVEKAWVVTDEINYDADGTRIHLYPGVGVSQSSYDSYPASVKAKMKEAYICTNTLELSATDFVYYGDLVSSDSIAALKTKYPDIASEIDTYFDEAYYCKEGGLYGGGWYETGRNYRALEAWCSMSAEDRANFKFNYDAFDLLIDPTFNNPVTYYDSENGTKGEVLYSKKQAVDYTATYNGIDDLQYTNEAGGTKTYARYTVLSREEYEDIPNEQYHYSALKAEADGETVYVVKTSFMRGDTFYSVGNTVTKAFYDNLDADNKQKIAAITFDTAGEYYYCREEYNVNENGEGQSVTDIFTSSVYNSGDQVPVGCIITKDKYNALPNKQKDFVVHGTAPIETSTLYVSRESDIFDLSKGKIITVVFNYEYEESDEDGAHIEQISEKHVLNIHINFKSGVPQIGQLTDPSVVIPGTTIGLKVPNVTPGAFELLGGGWEIYATQAEAESHTNGTPYYNNTTPLYWYQDGYWVSYYAKTYLGKTFSNAVQFKVANYHDIDKVMADKEHHLYVDYPVVHRPSKIYIDGRATTSDESKSKLDLFKDFYGLTLYNEMDEDGYPKTISGGTLDGHAHVNEHVKEAQNLTFIFRGDVSPKAYTDWEPIANATNQCFEGEVHGDGYTISGLNNSLFGHLCGDVYNLGVMGSFTSAGIADEGSGYAENCWIESSATTMDAGISPIIGHPTRDISAERPVQIVNCYYPDTNVYTPSDENKNPQRGLPMQKPLKDFYNGEVAYDLNGFYLQKRYNDHHSFTTNSYGYYDADDLNSEGKMTWKTGHYETETNYTPFYVETRYDNDDFIYAGGTVPETVNERYNESSDRYYPIWPDDYIFFGQQLTYGHIEGREHQSHPSHINKANDRLLTSGSNRVYRAPAYYQSMEMGIAHFNPDAIFAAKSKDGAREALPGLTAIDFTGHNEVTDYKRGRNTEAPYSHIEGGAYYPPLLDDDGLLSFQNIDLTRNLLVYIPQPTTDANDPVTKTHSVVTDYLIDPTFAETNTTYRTVAANNAVLHGHRIVKNAEGTGYTAPVDHLLVDKNDFNAPIEYTFASGKRMWYQRVPDVYAGLTDGWEDISVPFSPELVTTQTKGELTHFYQSEGHNKGHEYWLREFKGNVHETDAVNHIAEGDFSALATGTESKEYTNTFLWDYYYSEYEFADHNDDKYHETYYSTSHTYEGYPRAQAATPYIIGFPGSIYYEFDLSGKFIPENTKTRIEALPVQTITFASKPAITIGVSDIELAAGDVKNGDYTFRPNYMSKNIAAGDYLLNAAGSSYDVQAAAKAAVPFRPYFVNTAAAPAKGNNMQKVRHITFNQPGTSFGGGNDDDLSEGIQDGMNIYAKKGKIIVESGLSYAVDVRIVTTSGATVTVFTVEPGEKVETIVPSTGLYVVGAGEHSKKLRVEK
jgi:hypothetical protein